MDRHLNIFHAYRQGNLKDSERERVLEDNVTRALLITLASSSMLTREFLSEFAGVKSRGPYKYDLQSGLDAEESASKAKRLIAIAKQPDIPTSVQDSDSTGSRPDASIATKGAAVLFENKIQGTFSDAQIRRHLSVNFGENTVPNYRLRSHEVVRRPRVSVVLWSWRDVHEFFRQLIVDSRLGRDPVTRFTVNQFLEYLEMHGMGPVEFTQLDILDWESGNDSDVAYKLHDHMKTIGASLAERLGSHHADSHNLVQGYIGVNVLDDAFKGQPSEQVPHWSLGLGSDRQLRLYVQCEGKGLVNKLLKKRSQLEDRITNSLWSLWDEGGLEGLTLQVEHKLFIVPAGKGKLASLWTPYNLFPLELCSDKKALQGVVCQMFNALDHLHRPEVRAVTLKAAGLDTSRAPGKSAWGVFSLNYRWNWFELEKQKVAITDSVLEIATRMKPYYDALVETYQEPVRRRAQSK